jgi:Ribonuclease G/E
MEIIAVSARRGMIRIARLNGDELTEYWLWDRERPDGVGDLYTGRVESVAPALAGRFVDLGDSTGFLPDSHGGKNVPLGTYMVVTVLRAAQSGKGPRLGALAGTPAAKPGLMRRGGGPLPELAMRAPDAPILVDDHALLAQFGPALRERARFAANAFEPVLEDEIATLAEPVAALPMGARLHITPAPAATMLDVDSASASEQNLATLNAAIIPELCRQIVLRNLSGGILIDFAGLKPKARQALATPLRAALGADHLAPEFLGFSHLGFAELTRRRVRPALHEILAR